MVHVVLKICSVDGLAEKKGLLDSTRQLKCSLWKHYNNEWHTIAELGETTEVGTASGGVHAEFDSSNDVFHLYSSAGESVSNSEDVYELVIQVWETYAFSDHTFLGEVVLSQDDIFFTDARHELTPKLKPSKYDDGMFVCSENLDSVCCGLAACMSGFNGVAPPAGSAMRLTDSNVHGKLTIDISPPRKDDARLRLDQFVHNLFDCDRHELELEEAAGAKKVRRQSSSRGLKKVHSRRSFVEPDNAELTPLRAAAVGGGAPEAAGAPGDGGGRAAAGAKAPKRSFIANLSFRRKS